jgi:hypothetical protein
MIESSDQLVTIVGSSYFQPITDLIARLLGRPKPSSNEVQTSSHENGYCASLVLLLVAMLESYVMRFVILIVIDSQSKESRWLTICCNYTRTTSEGTS